TTFSNLLQPPPAITDLPALRDLCFLSPPHARHPDHPAFSRAGRPRGDRAALVGGGARGAIVVEFPRGRGERPAGARADDVGGVARIRYAGRGDGARGHGGGGMGAVPGAGARRGTGAGVRVACVRRGLASRSARVNPRLEPRTRDSSRTTFPRGPSHLATRVTERRVARARVNQDKKTRRSKTSVHYRYDAHSTAAQGSWRGAAGRLRRVAPDRRRQPRRPAGRGVGAVVQLGAGWADLSHSALSWRHPSDGSPHVRPNATPLARAT